VLTNWSNSIEHDLTPYKHIIALRNKVAERQSVQIAMRDEGLIS
ncbi:glutathione binding-like protein, partial [Acinetobacter baumannii]|nr:glutathione S-transferase [Acinetobacter baumannii]EKU9329745.1 glutathione S-transferase [Acinetobacter baumannii]